MGVFSDMLRGAGKAIANQSPPNINYLAELQRRRDAEQQRQDQLAAQAFAQMMRKKEFDQQQQNWNQTRQDNVYNNQQDDVYRETAFRVGLEQQLAANAMAKDKYQNIELPESKATIANLQEPNNKYAAGFGGSGSQQQGGFDPETAAKLAQQDAYKMAQQVDEYGDPTGQVDPVKFDEIVRQRYQFYANFNPAPQPRPQLPQGGAALMQGIYGGQPKQQQIAPMGAQGQPVTMSGGQAQPQMNRAAMLKQKFDADPSSLTPEEFDELGQYLNGGN